MGRPCRSVSALTSGGHPRSTTLISRSTSPDLRWEPEATDGRRHPPRRPRIGTRCGRQSPRGGRRGTIRGARARRRAGDRQDAAALRAGLPCRCTPVPRALRAGELELDLPFWVFVDALDEFVHGLDPHRLESLDSDVQAELATVFPSLAGLATGRRTASQHERYRSHRAVCVLLETLAQTQPVVLVLDDVHWADPASVE